MKYELSAQTSTMINSTFTYHAPKDDQPRRYEALRNKAHELAVLIAECTPPSPEQTLALRDLQRASMMANAAIAINER